MKQLKDIGQYLRQGLTISPHTALYVPWLHIPTLGYLMSFLLVALAVGLIKFLPVKEIHFIWIPFCLVSVVVGFVWGVSPALLATLLGLLAFNFFIIPESDLLTTDVWHDITLFGPFVLAQAAIAFLAAQNAVKHHRMHLARQEIQTYACELAATNQELERANRLKDDFLTRAAHELRTPLTTMLGETQLALRRARRTGSSVAECQRSLEKVEEQGRNLRALINDLIDLSNLRAEETPLRRTSCDLALLCQEVMEEQRAASGRRIELRLSSEPLVLQADCDRLFQALTNLVRYAAYSSRARTVISASISPTRAEVLLSICNDAPSLLPEPQERLFEPFYRAPLPENAAHSEWGLGLTMSKEIIERHGGQVRVETSAKGRSLFLVNLPLPSA